MLLLRCSDQGVGAWPVLEKDFKTTMAKQTAFHDQEDIRR